MTTALAVLAGYLAGSMPFGYWSCRLLKGVDIRNFGSGNIGATNVWRTFGWRYGLPIMLLDIAKGFVPALLGSVLVGDLAGVLAGAAAMAGHWRPLFLGFARGGKTVATTGGAFFGVAPVVALIGAGVWIAVFVLSRYASLASILAAASLPVAAVLLGEPWPVVSLAAVAALVVLLLHRANIGRLISGTESRFQLRRSDRRGRTLASRG
jgi:acyl phosphate:glycerol-3-phosphate acyltransferase